MAALDLVYVNDRIIAMAFPIDKRPMPRPPPAEEAAGGTRSNGGGGRQGQLPQPLVANGNDIDVVAAVLRSRHPGHYMVWNVSEEGYDYSMFEDQVSWLRESWEGSSW